MQECGGLSQRSVARRGRLNGYAGLKAFPRGKQSPQQCPCLPQQKRWPTRRVHGAEVLLASGRRGSRLAESRHAYTSQGLQSTRETNGVSPAVIRQQMGHSDARMTTLYTGEIPLKDVREAFSRVQDKAKNPLLENNGKWEAA